MIKNEEWSLYKISTRYNIPWSTLKNYTKIFGRSDKNKYGENWKTVCNAAMIDTFVKFKNESLKYGLTVNVHKTKYLKYSRRQDQLKPINIENEEIEEVISFKYLGSTVNTENTIEEEIKERIAVGNKAFYCK